MVADELFEAHPVLTSADPMFEPILGEEMDTAQFHDPFCVDIRCRLNKGVAVPFGDTENGILSRQVTHDQIIISHAVK